MRKAKVAAFASLVAFLAGCGGGGEVGEISGTVRFQGKPLSSGFVIFTSTSDPGHRYSSMTGQDGTYRISACPAGPVRITFKATVPRGGSLQLDKGNPAIPGRYANPKTSGLELAVRAGTQEHDIELVP